MKGTTLLVIFPCISLLLCSICSQGKQIRVTPGGSVKEAVARASRGDTVRIEFGHYSENSILVEKPLTIVGVDYPTLDGSGAGEILIISSDSVCIEGLHLVNVGVSFLHEPAAIRLVHVAHNIIANNRIDNCFFGIYLQYTSYSTIVGNQVTGADVDEAHAGNAIHIWKGDHILVKDNISQRHRDGIYFEFVDNSVIEGNRSMNNLRYGLHFMFSNDDSYTGNYFQNNGAGVAVMFSKRIVMEHNTFEHNWGGSSYGILLKEISHGRMSNNTFRKNTVGIYAEGATAIQISDNDFIGNGKAIVMKGNCIRNDVTHNNFYANTFEVYTNTRSNLNKFDSNYWSQYNAYDLDKNGVGDVPYRPVNLMALITSEVPGAYILLHSMLANSLDMFERVFPQLIPETLIDNHPMMNPVKHD
jgi:nitrous oxidase accessory protein